MQADTQTKKKHTQYLVLALFLRVCVCGGVCSGSRGWEMIQTSDNTVFIAQSLVTALTVIKNYRVISELSVIPEI